MFQAENLYLLNCTSEMVAGGFALGAFITALLVFLTFICIDDGPWVLFAVLAVVYATITAKWTSQSLGYMESLKQLQYIEDNSFSISLKLENHVKDEETVKIEVKWKNDNKLINRTSQFLVVSAEKEDTKVYPLDKYPRLKKAFEDAMNDAKNKE